tara:strand:- start:7063 stop:7668 length:606 start_codon:yes stop_codon:yes gene_type:complete
VKNIVWHNATIKLQDRKEMLNQKPFVLWFTGLSASGKSTIANIVEQKLFKMKYKTYLLDGDNVRHGLNKDLGFDEKSRVENIRRIGEVAKLFNDSGLIVLAAFISPFLSDRKLVRDLFPEENFLEVFIDSSLEVCEKRDPKGMYKKARSGEIGNFTGISSPYEKPKNPEIHLLNNDARLEDLSDEVIHFLIENKFIKERRF